MIVKPYFELEQKIVNMLVFRCFNRLLMVIYYMKSLDNLVYMESLNIDKELNRKKNEE